VRAPSSQTESSERLEMLTERPLFQVDHATTSFHAPHRSHKRLYIYSTCMQFLVVTEYGHCIALLTVRGTTCVCVGGGDEGGHPLPGLRRQSQEAHLQNGRYVRSSSYVCMFSWHIYILHVRIYFR